ncbi:MAG TPA: phenylalanine--tRNA ligase beta subunit-related protein [Solirubrobacterales bacterium]|jgi:DNA/RNA-binding domain of Phe-tRNA-synthetase-like protein|nr:phenylalanine--tRNA ligase beta subunit-related protein [Solirubrobacterales bacterium]
MAQKHEPAQPDLPDQQEAAPEPGWLAPELGEEFPGLGIFTTTVAAGPGRSPEALRERLRELSDRFAGQQAIVLRQRPIPWAYRVFFRHIGLDPDDTRTPVEQVAFERMHDGRFKTRNRLDDALTIATAEVGVALQAFDADSLEGRLGLRLSADGEHFEGRVSPLPTGTIVIADERRALAILFGKVAEGVSVQRTTRRTTLAAIRVKGVPDVALEEALWLASSAMLA